MCNESLDLDELKRLLDVHIFLPADMSKKWLINVLNSTSLIVIESNNEGLIYAKMRAPVSLLMPGYEPI